MSKSKIGHLLEYRLELAWNKLTIEVREKITNSYVAALEYNRMLYLLDLPQKSVEDLMIKLERRAGKAGRE